MDVWPHLERYALAFRRLSAGRVWQTGMAGAWPMRISEAEKSSYAHGRGFAATDEEYERFTQCVDAQDDVFMGFHADEAAKKGKGSEGVESVSVTTDDDV